MSAFMHLAPGRWNELKLPLQIEWLEKSYNVTFELEILYDVSAVRPQAFIARGKQFHFCHSFCVELLFFATECVASVRRIWHWWWEILFPQNETLMMEYREYIDRLQRRLNQAEQRAATASQQVPSSQKMLSKHMEYAKVLTFHHSWGRGDNLWALLPAHF